MTLSNDLISQFVRITNDRGERKKESVTYYATVVEQDGKAYVKLDGSEVVTPVATTTNVKNGERVMVMIKNHTAIITGNVSSPSARLLDIEDQSDSITQLESILSTQASNLAHANGRIDNLINEDTLIKGRLTTTESNIASLQKSTLDIRDAIDTLQNDKLDVDVAKDTYATITEMAELDTKYSKALNDQKILWSAELVGGLLMSEDDEVVLTESVSKQKQGIALAFCVYENNEEYSWQTFFIPKTLITAVTTNHTFNLVSNNFTYIGMKCLYISDMSISGHANNILTGTKNGITYANNKFVLRYVYGV